MGPRFRRPAFGTALVVMLSLLAGGAPAGAGQRSVDRVRATLTAAIANFRAGRIQESVEGFDLAVEMAPEYAPELWQRGIALYYADRFEDCRDQFVLHRTVNPNDVENPVWHFLCVARLESPEAARKGMLPVGFDSRIPMAQVYGMFSGLGTPEEVLAAVDDDPRSQFYAELYLGLYYEALGDAERSLEHIRAAAADRFQGPGGFMHAVARVHRDLRERGR